MKYTPFVSSKALPMIAVLLVASGALIAASGPRAVLSSGLESVARIKDALSPAANESFRTPQTSDYRALDQSFRTPQTSDYSQMGRSFQTPQTSDYRPADESFRTPQTSDYRPVDPSFRTPQTSDYGF